MLTMHPARTCFAVLTLSLLLAACGSDSDPNKPPSASAGDDKSAIEATLVALTGSGTDQDGQITTYAWIQTGGPGVTLTGANAAAASFTAPEVNADTPLTFQLTVTDNRGDTASDSLVVTVTSDDPPSVSAGSDRDAAEGETVTLGAVATDTDGTIATYAWTQTGGPAVTLIGANTVNASFVAPAVAAITDLDFSVVVTDDDGRQASDSVTISVEPTLVLSGVITDGPIPNANVTVRVGDQTYTATAGADGTYTVTLPATATDAFVSIEATGGPGQESVKLVSIAGSLGSLVDAAGSDGVLSTEDKDVVNVTNVSTAKAVLVIASNGGTTPTDDATLDELERSLDGTELMELAIAIKLVIDEGIALPAGATDTLSMVESFVAEEASFDTFLADVDAVDPDLRDEVFAAIIADPNLVPPASGVEGTYLLSRVGGYLNTNRGLRIVFAADGTGSLASATGGLQTFEWMQAEDGSITVVYDTPRVTQGFVNHPTTGLQEQSTTTSAGFTLRQLIDGATSAQWLQTTTNTTTWLTGPVVAPFVGTDEIVLILTKPGGYLPFSATDLPGTWMVPIIGPPSSSASLAAVESGFLTFAADGTGVRDVDGAPFTWTLPGGALRVAFADGSVIHYYGTRRDGIATDVVTVAEMAGGGVFASSALMVERTTGVSFGAGRYSLYGDGPRTNFDIVANGDGTSADESYTPQGVLLFSQPGAWELDSNGVRHQSYHFDEVLSRDVAVCSDLTRCNRYRERDWTPVAQDGLRVFLFELQRRFAYDATKPFRQGALTFYQPSNRFFTFIPATSAQAKPGRSHRHVARTTGDPDDHARR